MDLIKQDIPALLGRLAGELSNLAKDEIAIAKIELRQSAKEAVTDGATVAAGVGLVYAGIIFLLLAGMFGLSSVMPMWASAALVGVLALAIGGLTAHFGAQRMKTDVPQLKATKETLKTNGYHLKEQLTP